MPTVSTGLPFFSRLALLLALILPAAAPGLAQQLPLKYYTTADGLPYDAVARVVQDSRGLIWVCTSNGLGRFDGSRFIVYRDTDGLMPQVNHVLETRGGALWVATNGGGVYRIDARGKPDAAPETAGASAPEPSTFRRGLAFIQYPVGGDFATMRVNKLYEDQMGRIWAGTDAGLFFLSKDGDKFERFSLGFPEQQERITQVWDFAENSGGTLWIATKFGLVRLLPDGRVLRHPALPGAGRDVVLALLPARDGRLWVGHERGLIVFVPTPEGEDAGGAPWRRLELRSGAGPTRAAALPTAPGEARLFNQGDGLAHDRVRALAQTEDGHIWAGTSGGLSEFDGAAFSNYTEAQGFRGGEVNSICKARDGSLWLGTQSAGLARLLKGGFTVFRLGSGRGDGLATSLSEDAEGQLYAFDTAARVSLFDPARARFVSARLNLPEAVFSFGWNSSRRGVKALDGEWWVGTGIGLFRFPRVERIEELARARPKAHYTTRDGLAYDDVANLFQDSRGDLWFSAFATTRVAVTRWERATGAFHNYSDADGLPAFNSAVTFCEDTAGRIWVGFREGGVARYDRGRFTVLRGADGMTSGQVTRLMAARDGRVWVTTLAGVARIDDPGAEHPRARMYTTRDGLFSNQTFGLAEDERGRVYVGTANLLDRLDPAADRVEHFDRSDGLTGSIIFAATRDLRGALWFATPDGLMRYVPGAEAPRAPPAVYISGLRVAGQPVPIPALGVTTIPALELAPDQNNIQVDFFGIAYDLREGLGTQYKLEGAGSEWSAPTADRSLTFARLAPGSYRLLVRAVTPDGLVSAEPAVLSLTVLRPVWQRWWFVALALLAAAAAVYALYRYRVAQLLKVERVRTRIATDLHDDIGASLSQIAILSEVVTQRVTHIGGTGPLVAPANGDGARQSVTQPLAMIANTSRELVDSMSDIVWAINPQRDHLEDLGSRMRRFAGDILGARDIELRFHSPDEDGGLRLGADLRREVYLIFKETVNNAAKYADCAEIAVDFHVAGGWLVVVVRDDGRGFEVGAADNGQHTGLGGHGLQSMRRRAAALGGSYEIDSAPGRGTVVTLRVPVGGGPRRLPHFLRAKLRPLRK